MVSLYSFGSEWTKLYQSDGFSKDVEVYYSSLKKKVLIKFKSGLFSKEREEVFDAANVEQIDTLISSISKTLNEKNFKKDLVEEIVTSVENIKYLDGSSCNVVIFADVAPESATSLTPIVSEITQKLEEDLKEQRSFFVTTVDIEGKGPVELRAIADNKLNILKFSLFSNKSDISKLKIIKDGDFYHVMDGEKYLMTLEASKNDRNTVTIFKKKEHGLQNTNKVVLEVLRDNNQLSARKVLDTQSSKLDTKREIILSNDKINHEKVVRIDGSERFFKSITNNELQFNFFYNSPKYIIEIEEVFVKCMNDRLVSRENLISRGTLDQARLDCIKISELETILNEDIEKNNFLSIQEELSGKAIRERLVSCLDSKGLFQKVEHIRLIQSPLKVSVKDINQCLEQGRRDVSTSELARSIDDDFKLQSFLVDDSLITNLRTKVLLEHSSCLEKDSKENCEERIAKRKIPAALEVFLEDRGRRKNLTKDILVKAINEFRLCPVESKKSCLSKTFLFIERESGELDLQGISESIAPELGVRFNDEDKRVFQENYNKCYSSEKASGDELLSLANSLVEKSYDCQLLAYKKVAPSGIASFLIGKDPYNSFNEEKSQSFKAVLKREISKELSSLRNIVELREALSKVEESAVIPYLDFYIEDRLENSKLNSRDKREIKKILLSTVAGDSKLSLNRNIESHIKKQRVKDNKFKVKFFSNQFLKTFEKELYARENLDAHSAFQSCLDEYSPKWEEIRFSDYLRKCKRLSKKNNFLKEMKQKLENDVGQSFSLTSVEANNILTPIYYLEECLELIPTQSGDESDFESQMKGCFIITELDVFRNISEIQIQKNKSLLSDKGESSESMSEICYENMFLLIGSEVKKSDLINSKMKNKYLSALKSSSDKTDLISIFRKSHLKIGSGSLLENLKYGSSAEKENLNILISVVGNDNVFHKNWVSDYAKKCSESIDKVLFDSFRNFILNKIPSSQNLSSKFSVEENRNILTAVFDNELLNEILILSRKRGMINEMNPSSDIRETIVSGEFSTEALANLISVLGEYLAEGLIFDKESMETELVVFRSELKRALQWMNKQNKSVKLSDIKDFFKTTRLADIMAYAVVSKNVSKLFDDYLLKEERREELEFLSRFKKINYNQFSDKQKVQWNRMKSKYRQLRYQAGKMTSAYDFKRLFRDGSEGTRKNLDMIKSEYLLPLITNGKASPAAEGKVLKIVADLIVKDNSDGGFAERFAATAANEFLKNDNDSHWAITKFFFYDDKDFSWETLRSTKSGSKAINYYTKHILLPEVVGQKLAKHTKNTRLNHFKFLLEKAQSENDE